MKHYLVYIFLFFYTGVWAQPFFETLHYPKSFISPVHFPIQLVGNFGECRPNHFHSGLDIRTNSQENKKIYAIESGFVSRIKIEPGGFGNAIYITHTNGFTSVYAHLNRFFPALENFVRRNQYASKSWQQDIYLAPHQFPIQKDDFIAWSGNTGSSQGPHLHMEIRNTKTEAPLNGLLFYPSLADTKAPILKQLAIYDATQSIYEQSPILYSLSKQNNTYQPATKNIEVTSQKIYFGIQADDVMDQSTGKLGVYELSLYVDDKPYFAWRMNDISYDITRYMNALADYKTKKSKNTWIQLCHQLPNDQLTVYKSLQKNKGIVSLELDKPCKIKIVAKDTKNNSSIAEFFVSTKNISNKATCEEQINAGKAYTYKSKLIEFESDADAFYDYVCFKANTKESNLPYSYLYQLHYDFVPLHTAATIRLTPKAPIPENLKSKIAIAKLSVSEKEKYSKGMAATIEHGKAVAKIKELGNYEIVIDQTAPSISTTLKNNTNISKMKRLYFTIKEDITDVSTFEASVDGQWLRLVRKGNTFFYELDDYFPTGTHVLTIQASDQNNNTSLKTFKLIR
ncbi:MAG: M23 family metallopeptidase [Chitinophagaceae bacterium]